MTGEKFHRLCARAGVLLAICAVAGGVATASASAQSSKPFAIVVCAPTESCGPAVPAVTGLSATGATLTATFTNENKLGTGIKLGSLNLTPPAGITVDGTKLSLSGCSGCTATLDALGIIELRGLNQAPQGQPIVLTMGNVSTAASGCTAAAPCTWGYEAKQSNDFSGPPGNDLTLDANTSSITTVLGSLQFVTQPTGAQVGQDITGTPYDPNGPAVSVEVIDSAGKVTAYDGSVALALSNPAVTLGGTPAQASAGIAFFTALTVGAPGYGYTLTASSQDSLPTATSTSFDVHAFASQVQCKGNVCSNSVNDSAKQQQLNASTLTGSSGQLFVGLDPASSFWATNATACGNYTFLDSDMATINLSASSAGKLIQNVITIPVVSVNAIKTITAGEQFCLAAPYQFTAKGGAAASGPVIMPDGSVGFVGLVDDCSIQPNQPCVSARLGTKVKNSNPLLATFEIDVTIPAGLTGDPWGRA
jgi:hypothetical protein